MNAQTSTAMQQAPAGGGGGATTKKDNAALYAAIGAIIFFLILTVYLAAHIGDTDTQWTRLTYLFGAIEAIALAAFGFLWGKEIHRERADKAEKRADDAEKNNDKTKDDLKQSETAKGKLQEQFSALTSLIETKAEGRRGTLATFLERHMANDPNLAADIPGLTDFVSNQRERLAQRPATDPDWDELLKFSRRLQRP